MGDDLINSNVLYFPHIEISDPTSLKSALCIWENVFRIVPSNFVPSDSDEVKQAVDAGVLQDIHVSSDDLVKTREDFSEFIESIEYLPDALSRTPKNQTGMIDIHYEKIDGRLIMELSELLGHVRIEGDWLRLPRGLAEGYMIYLSNTVARRRQLPKFTDSETLFVSMQYFDLDGNFCDAIRPEPEDDFCAAMILKSFVPQGIADAPMSRVLEFHRANRDGRAAFRKAAIDVAKQLATVEDEEFVLDLIEKFRRQLDSSQRITLSRIREYFAQPEALLIYLGLPLAAKAYELATDVKHNVLSLGALGIAGIAALADLAKSKRKEWVPAEATYYCSLGRAFENGSPIPRPMRPLGAMMDEFMND